MSSLNLARWATVSAFMFLVAGSASAGTFTIFDLTDSLSSQALNFIGGNPSVNCSQGETCTFTITAPVGTTMSIDFRTVFMTEGVGGPLSDWLTCNDCSQTGASVFNFTFNSDVDGVPLSPPQFFLAPINTVVEDGTAQTVMTITYSGQTVGTNTILVESDLEAVPEPSTWMMALTGLGVVGCALRRRLMSA